MGTAMAEISKKNIEVVKPQKQIVQQKISSELPELPVLLQSKATPQNLQENAPGLPALQQKFTLLQRDKKTVADKPSLLVEHLRNYYSNYITHNPSGLDEGASLLFQELLNNSIDEYLEGHGNAIDVLCNTETITLRDYGRGIDHDQLHAASQEFSAKSKQNSHDIQYCEGLSGLGLKLANALSSRFLLRSYRNQRFAELKSAKGLKLHERQGRCEKKIGTFIRFTPDAQIFGKQPVQAAVLAEILAKAAALHPGLELRLNQDQIFLAKGPIDLFALLPRWRGQKYLYTPRSLGGKNWQLSFAHLAEWQRNGGGLQNPLWVASFVNGRECAGGQTGGQHMRQLQGAFLWALLRTFPQRKEQLQAFWDEGITLFFAIKLIEPEFVDSGKRRLLGNQVEIATIIHECQEQLLKLFSRDAGFRNVLEKLLDERSELDEKGEYKHWQQQLSGELLQIEHRAQKLDQALEGQQKRSSDLERNLQKALDGAAENQKHWEESSRQIHLGIEETTNELHAIQKWQRTEQSQYHKEWEQRLQNLEEERNACYELKEDLQKQAQTRLEDERRRQKLVASGLESWNHLKQALQAASELQKQRDQEQEQILEYLENAREAVEAKHHTAEQNIELAEQKMLLRQEAYLENFENNANAKFHTIHDEIEQRQQDLQTTLESEQQKAYEKLEKLHQQFAENLNAEEQNWQKQLEKADKHSTAELQRITAQREQSLEHSEQLWREKEAALTEQNQKQQHFLERWQERLDESRREAQAHQNIQYELVQNREELEKFFAEQRSTREEQAQKWQEQLEQNQKNLDENQQKINAQLDEQYETQQTQQQEWKQQTERQKREIDAACSEQIETLDNLRTKLERNAQQQIQNQLSSWLEHFEKLGQESEQQFRAQQKLLQTRQQTLNGELTLVQQEKTRLWDGWNSEFNHAHKQMTQQLTKRQLEWQKNQNTLQVELEQVQKQKEQFWAKWQKEFGQANEQMGEQLTHHKQEWDKRQEGLLQEFDEHLQKLKQKQYAQQYRIEETQVEQAKILKELQQFQRDADESLNSLNKNLLACSAQLREEIQNSMAELRDITDHQFVQAEQKAQDQERLYQQNLLEREQESQNVLERHQKDFAQKLEQKYLSLDAWNEDFTRSFEDKKQSLRQSLDDFHRDLEQRQQEKLSHELSEWSKAFESEQENREREAAAAAQNRREQFWSAQQLAANEDAQQQRQEFQDLHKQLQGTIEREREHLQRELGRLQELTRQQEREIEALKQNLSRDVETHSERLKQDMQENYQHFHNEILENTRALHQLQGDERRALRDELANMRTDIGQLKTDIGQAEQTVASLQKALPGSLQLQESLKELNEKQQLIETMERETSQLQDALKENQLSGQEAAKQMDALLARRSELSNVQEQIQQVLQLSSDLHEQRADLEAQQGRVSDYQNQLHKLEHLYGQSSNLLQLFDEHKDQLLESASVLYNYQDSLSELEQKVQGLQGQLEPLELGFEKAHELRGELEGQQQELQNAQQQLSQMQQAITALHDDSRGIDKMREWIAKTETRMLELSRDIQGNLRTVETIVRKNRSGERTHGTTGKVDSDVRNTVIQLHGKNWNNSEIARATQLSVGEVELILEMLPSAS